MTCAVSLLWLCCGTFASAEARPAWTTYLGEGHWSIDGAVVHGRVESGSSAMLRELSDMADVMVEADVRMAASGRAIFGLVMRARESGDCLVVRFHDLTGALELLRYEQGIPHEVGPQREKVPFLPLHWHHLKAAVIGDTVLAKWWPEGGDEPAWQLVSYSVDAPAGRVGVMAVDDTTAEFRNITVRTGEDIGALCEQVAEMKAAHTQRLRANMSLALEPTPLVLRTDKGPRRRVDVHLKIDGKPAPIGGTLVYTFGETRRELQIKPSDLIQGSKQLLLPEPDRPTDLHVLLDSDVGTKLEARSTVTPVRQWHFYMTEHTHYDIGFTAPQKVVMDQLSRDMEMIVPFAAQTADWPEESRFRWTVEVTALMKNYLERHSRAELEPLLSLIRSGSVEVCGFYLNMACELTGHEELIRCVYEAQRLRDAYNIPIDTVMIDDVPGYSWALPEILTEAGMPRVSFRANSIRGQFLWYRDGAMPRPCWWEGPDGSRVLFWYTDSYREGNFWRNPGLQENRFLEHIQRNEASGATSDHIQLRMGGDNLPPDLDACVNCRQWNETYVWPKVRIATNREFLEVLEREYGKDMPVVRGDIPSWWAEGPGSSAAETGMNRLVHDQIVDTEGLWTLACLAKRDRKHPHPAIHDVYDNMLHYDEHTWGSSLASNDPRHETTIYQWNFKSRFAHQAKSLTDDLEHHALQLLSSHIKPPDNAKNAFAVINTLPWNRTDVVELSTATLGLAESDSVSVVDVRSDSPVPWQMSADREALTFIACDVPSMGYALYRIVEGELSGTASSPPSDDERGNGHYVLSFVEERGVVGCVDRDLGLELFDQGAGLLPNHAVIEKLNADRDGVRSKTPLKTHRIPAPIANRPDSGPHLTGDVYEEWVGKTALPNCPRILQTVRLYRDLKLIEWTNEVVKEESFDREGLYFAFPFDVPSPTFHLSIANAEMRAGIDQVPYSCQDFYAVQHYVDVEGDGFGIVFVPVDAPNVTLSDFNAYKWADRIAFDRGHVYSMALNNYWFTNFRAGQHGTLLFRYRMTSYEGQRDPISATQFAWQAFRPLRVVRLDSDRPVDTELPRSLLSLEGDPVIVSCVKTAEQGQDMIIRLLEMRGRQADCTLRFDLPAGLVVQRASLADVLERPISDVGVKDNAVSVTLRPREICTLRITATDG